MPQSLPTDSSAERLSMEAEAMMRAESKAEGLDEEIQVQPSRPRTLQGAASVLEPSSP